MGEKTSVFSALKDIKSFLEAIQGIRDSRTQRDVQKDLSKSITKNTPNQVIGINQEGGYKSSEN